MIYFTIVLILLTEAITDVQSAGVIRRYKNSKSMLKDLRQNGYYDFQYLIDHEDSQQYRKEIRKNGKVTGSYGIVDPDGRRRMVYYIADEDGFRAKVDTNEPGVFPMNAANVEISKFGQTFNNLVETPQHHTSTSPPDTTPFNNIDQHTTLFKENEGSYIFPLSPFNNFQKDVNSAPVSYSLLIDHNQGKSWDAYSLNNVSPYGYSSNLWKALKSKNRKQ